MTQYEYVIDDLTVEKLITNMENSQSRQWETKWKHSSSWPQDKGRLVEAYEL